MIGGANAMWTVRTKWWWRQILVKIVSLLCGLRFLERVAPPLHMGCDMFGGSSSEIYHVFPLKIKRRIGWCVFLMRGGVVHICVRQWSMQFVSWFFVGGVRSRWHLLYTNSPVKLKKSPTKSLDHSSSTELDLQYWWGPVGSLFSYLSRSPLHWSGSKCGTSACKIVIVFLSIVNKRLWRQFLCGIYGCLDRVYSTLVR